MDLSILLMFAAFGVLVAIEVPIAFALAGSALFYLVLNPVVPLSIVVQRMAPGLDSFPLLAVPLFILAGQLLNTSGIATRIFRFAHALVGHIRGGLAHCNVVASMIFSAMSGVAQADAAGLGLIEIKAMRERGFDPAFAAAVSASSAIIGPIIPPSVIMVIYGLLAQVSVADLFLAGILPGLLMGASLMGMVYFLAVTGRVVCPVEPRASFKELKESFRAGLPAFLAPLMLVGGLMLGVATPTELGALTVVYAIALGFWYGELTWQDVFDAASETVIFCGVLVFIIAAAVPFGWLISYTRLPAELAATVLQFTKDPVAILAIINVLLLCPRLLHGDHGHPVDRDADLAAHHPGGRHRSGALWHHHLAQPDHRRHHAAVRRDLVHFEGHCRGDVRAAGARRAALLCPARHCAADRDLLAQVRSVRAVPVQGLKAHRPAAGQRGAPGCARKAALAAPAGVRGKRCQAPRSIGPKAYNLRSQSVTVFTTSPSWPSKPWCERASQGSPLPAEPPFRMTMSTCLAPVRSVLARAAEAAGV